MGLEMDLVVVKYQTFEILFAQTLDPSPLHSAASMFLSQRLCLQRILMTHIERLTIEKYLIKNLTVY